MDMNSYTEVLKPENFMIFMIFINFTILKV